MDTKTEPQNGAAQLPYRDVPIVRTDGQTENVRINELPMDSGSGLPMSPNQIAYKGAVEQNL